MCAAGYSGTVPAVEIVPAGPLRAEVSVPGSKSLTNRALICAALAPGRSLLKGVSRSADTRVLVEALRALGVAVEPRPGPALSVEGRGPTSASAALSMGNAGTSLRFVTALAAAGKGEVMIDGDERMRERPIGGLVDALRGLGAEISYAGREGFPPVRIVGRGLRGGRVEVEGATSSQFLSAVLLAAPSAAGAVEARPQGALSSRGYVDMTLQVMEAFGVRPAAPWRIEPTPYRACEFRVEADAAAAGYWFAMAAATGGRVRVEALGSGCRQPEIGLLDDLAAMGAKVERGAGFTVAEGGPLRGIDADLNDRPDSVPALAAVALFAKGRTRIRNVAHLRHKESDRLAALARELGKCGARVVEHRDGLEIDPPERVGAATIETYRDHRMAMAFAVAASAAPGLRIQDPDVVGKSYPEFWTALKRAGVAVEWRSNS